MRIIARVRTLLTRLSARRMKPLIRRTTGIAALSLAGIAGGSLATVSGAALMGCYTPRVQTPKAEPPVATKDLFSFLEGKDLKKWREGLERIVGLVELGKLDRNKVIDRFIPLLNKGKPQFKIEIILALVELNAEKAINDIVSLVSNKNDVVRYFAVEALGKLGASKAVNILFHMFKDEESDLVRGAVVSALCKLGDKKLVGELIPLLESRNASIRKGAAKILGKLEAKEAVDKLIPLLEDKNPGVRAAAAEALGNLDAKEAVDKLIPLLADNDPDVRRNTAFALGELRAKKAAERIIALLCKDGKISVIRSAGRALGRLGDKKMVYRLLFLFKDEKLEINNRAGIVRAIGEIGGKEAVETLTLILQMSKRKEIWYATVEALIKTGDQRAILTIIKALEKNAEKIQEGRTWEAIKKGMPSIGTSTKMSEFNSPRLTADGRKIIFPRGYLPKDGGRITIKGYQRASTAPRPKEVTFVFDASGSMKQKIDQKSADTKFDVLKRAFKALLDMSPGDKDVTYKLNAFGHEEQTPGFEIEADGTNKDELKKEMDKVKVGGATHLWANIEYSLRNTEKNGVVVVYSDGRSDTSAFLKNGPKEKNIKGKIEDIMDQVKKKKIQICIVCGTKEAEDHIKQEFNNAGIRNLSGYNIFTFPAYDKNAQDIFEKIARDKIVKPEGVYYEVFIEDSQGNITRPKGFDNPPPSLLARGDFYKVKSGEVNYGIEDQIEIVGSVTYEDKQENNKVLKKEDFVPEGLAEYVFDEVIRDIRPTEISDQVITLVLDRSLSMEGEKLKQLKTHSKAFSRTMIAEGAKIGVNSFSGWNKKKKGLGKKDVKRGKRVKEAKVELFATDNVSKIDKVIDSMESYGYTLGWENILLSLLATPHGGNLVVFSDGEFNGKHFGEEAIDLAKRKNITVYFIGLGKDYANPEGHAYIKLNLLTHRSGGKFVSINDISKLESSFNIIKEQIEQKERTLKLPKPTAIRIPVRKGNEQIVLEIKLPNP